jgi:nicotinamide-nucleotide amidase
MKPYIQTVQTIIQTLSEHNHSITFAESCTGGRIAAAFTAVSGSSAVLNGSVVSYSNAIKTQWLGVKPSTLEQHGAVSQECVHEMLGGILKMAEADYAIAVSGIAGPTGGTPDKPVGTVYIGIRTPESETIHHCLFEGDRESVQEQSVEFAVTELSKMLSK